MLLDGLHCPASHQHNCQITHWGPRTFIPAFDLQSATFSPLLYLSKICTLKEDNTRFPHCWSYVPDAPPMLCSVAPSDPCFIAAPAPVTENRYVQVATTPWTAPTPPVRTPPPRPPNTARIVRTKSVGEILETNLDDDDGSPLVRQASSHSKSMQAMNDTLLETDM